MNLSVPLTAQLEVTDKCNFRCPHCYILNSAAQQRKTADLSDEKVMYLAGQLADAGVFSVVLTGGEPLFRRQLLYRLIRYFVQHNTYVSLNTNLSLCSQRVLEVLADCGLDSMLVSCPASDAIVYREMTGNGNLAHFERNVRALLSTRIQFAANMVVNRANLRLIQSTAAWLSGMGVKSFGISPMSLNERYPNYSLFLTRDDVSIAVRELLWVKDSLGMNVDIYESIAKCAFEPSVLVQDLPFLKRRCQAGKTIVSVSNSGDVRPCSHNPDAYGNLFKDSLATIWARMGEWRDMSHIPERCQSCKVLSRCFGGCRITARTVTQDRKGEDPWMTAPMVADTLVKPPNPVRVTTLTVVKPSAEFRWRKEGDGYVACTKSAKNATLMNEHLFSFVRTLRDRPPTALSDLAVAHNTKFSNPDFLRIVSALIERGFLRGSGKNWCNQNQPGGCMLNPNVTSDFAAMQVLPLSVVDNCFCDCDSGGCDCDTCNCDSCDAGT